MQQLHDPGTNQTHIVLVNAVIFKGDKVLVSQRSWKETHAPGKWTIPGGKVERTAGGVYGVIEKTLKDEVREETGVEIEDSVELISNNTFIRSTGHHVISLVFKCKYKSGEAKPLEDTIDCRWVTLEEAKKMEFAPSIKECIELAFKRN